MYRGVALLAGVCLLTAASVPAVAGILDDQARRIKLTYDDADWKAGPNGWPLTCINIACASFSCTTDGASSDDTDKQALRAARDSQADLVEMLETKAVVKPTLRTFGSTKGVYRAYFDAESASAFSVFDFMTLGPAKRVKLSCEGETRDGKPITKLFEKLMTGLELY